MRKNKRPRKETPKQREKRLKKPIGDKDFEVAVNELRPMTLEEKFAIFVALHAGGW